MVGKLGREGVERALRVDLHGRRSRALRRGLFPQAAQGPEARSSAVTFRAAAPATAARNASEVIVPFRFDEKRRRLVELNRIRVEQVGGVEEAVLGRNLLGRRAVRLGDTRVGAGRQE